MFEKITSYFTSYFNFTRLKYYLGELSDEEYKFLLSLTNYTSALYNAPTWSYNAGQKVFINWSFTKNLIDEYLKNGANYSTVLNGTEYRVNYNNTGYVNPMTKNLIRDAFSEWQRISNGMIQFHEVNLLNEYGIEVVGCDSYNNMKSTPFTFPRYNNGKIAYVLICFFRDEIIPGWDDKPYALRKWLIYNTKHEIGHALGFQHPDSLYEEMLEQNEKGCNKTIMAYPEMSCKQVNISLEANKYLHFQSNLSNIDQKALEHLIKYQNNYLQQSLSYPFFILVGLLAGIIFSNKVNQQILGLTLYFMSTRTTFLAVSDSVPMNLAFFITGLIMGCSTKILTKKPREFINYSYNRFFSVAPTNINNSENTTVATAEYSPNYHRKKII